MTMIADATGTTTITEALAELKTIAKRIEKKRVFVTTPWRRKARRRSSWPRSARRSKDLQERTIAIRCGLAQLVERRLLEPKVVGSIPTSTLGLAAHN